MHPLASQKVIYPLLFWIRKEPFYKDLSLLREYQWHDSSVILERQLMRFRVVAEAGIKSFAFYKSMVAESGISTKDIQSLDDVSRWPIMTKRELNQAVAQKLILNKKYS